MKQISPVSLITLLSLSLFLSACTAKTTTTVNTGPSVTTPSVQATQTADDQQYQQQVSDLQSDTSTSSDDKALLNALSQDSDNDFSSEFSTLEKDLQ